MELDAFITLTPLELIVRVAPLGPMIVTAPEESATLLVPDAMESPLGEAFKLPLEELMVTPAAVAQIELEPFPITIPFEFAISVAPFASEIVTPAAVAARPFDPLAMVTPLKEMAIVAVGDVLESASVKPDELIVTLPPPE